MLNLVLERSSWPNPVPNAHERALEDHIDALAHWLLIAGAEPRFFLVFCSGPDALEDLEAGLTASSVEVVMTHSTAERPMPSPVVRHVGDHFNKTLYLIDGLDGPTPEALISTLSGQVSILRRTATWVGLVVKDIETLAHLEAYGTPLLDAAQTRWVIVNASELGSTRDRGTSKLSTEYQQLGLASLIHTVALTPSNVASYHELARLARSGYGISGSPENLHPEKRRILSMLSPTETAAITLDHNYHVSSEVLLRHRKRVGSDEELRLFARSLRQQTRLRYEAQLDVSDIPLFRAMRDVSEMGKGTMPFTETALNQLRNQSKDEAFDSGCRVHLHLCLAAGEAAGGNLTGCQTELSLAFKFAKMRTVAPELRFEVLEKRLQVQVFVNGRADARESLDEIERLAPLLNSPFYSARAVLARAGFLAPLDQARARMDFDTAERQFVRHGYPKWAAQSRAGREGAS